MQRVLIQSKMEFFFSINKYIDDAVLKSLIISSIYIYIDLDHLYSPFNKVRPITSLRQQFPRFGYSFCDRSRGVDRHAF